MIKLILLAILITATGCSNNRVSNANQRAKYTGDGFKEKVVYARGNKVIIRKKIVRPGEIEDYSTEDKPKNPVVLPPKEDKIIISNEQLAIKSDFYYPTNSTDFSLINNSKRLKFNVSKDEPIKAIAPGMVIFAGQKPTLGNSIFIYHNDGFISIYTNLHSLTYKKGDYIKKSETIIGIAKETFIFELRHRTKNGVVSLNPTKYLNKRI